MASMMSLRMVLNASVESTEVLVSPGIVEVRARMFVGSVTKVFETVDLTSKVGDSLVVAALPTVGAGTRARQV